MARTLFVCLFVLTSHLTAGLYTNAAWHSFNPRASGPAVQYGNYFHSAGEGTFSYRFRMQSRTELKAGLSVLADDEYPAYDNLPVRETVLINEIGISLAPVDLVTMDLKFPMVYHSSKVDLATEDDHLVTRVFGLGDIGIDLVFRLPRFKRNIWGIKTGISAPTGSVKKGSGEFDYPYNLQTGSGTIGLRLAAILRTQFRHIILGQELGGVITAGRNDREWRQGNSISYDLGLAWHPFRWLRLAGRLQNSYTGAIKGRNLLLERDYTGEATYATGDEDNYGAYVLDLGLGLDFFFFRKVLGYRGQRLSFEMMLPLIEYVNGYQLSRQWQLNLAWQVYFDIDR